MKAFGVITLERLFDSNGFVKGKQVRKRRWWIVFSLFGFLACSMCAYISVGFYFGEKETCWEAEHLPYFVLENHGHFKFPASAQTIEVKTKSRWTECYIAVRFEMPASELELFVSSTNIQTLNHTPKSNLPDEYYRDTFKDLGFTVSALKSSLHGENFGDFFNSQYLYVDTTNSESYVVYLVTNQGFLD